MTESAQHSTNIQCIEPASTDISAHNSIDISAHNSTKPMTEHQQNPRLNMARLQLVKLLEQHEKKFKSMISVIRSRK